MNIWSEKKFKTAKNAISQKMCLISRVFLPGLFLNFLAHYALGGGNIGSTTFTDFRTLWSPGSLKMNDKIFQADLLQKINSPLDPLLCIKEQ